MSWKRDREEYGSESDDEEEEEENSNESGSDEYDEDEQNDEGQDPVELKSATGTNQLSASTVPLFQRLAEQNSENSINCAARERVMKRRKLEREQDAKSNSQDRRTIAESKQNPDARSKAKKSKNAPAEMASNRPVRRLRVDTNNTNKQSVDPRFTEFSGRMNEKIFAKDYAFLDDYRDNEISELSKSLRKIKSETKKSELKSEIIKMKQQSKERKRGVKVMERLEHMKRDEREKVKQGKKPFFLKKSAKHTIELEERYKELRQEGKLHKFMEKKRKKNSNKDHRWIPGRRGDGDGGEA
mmetsp:Transcript_1752/g.2982  ORF Transcript_1752/g.2982 Transcript_1752/m.2982 type:complete len:299 (-) Transcript_1752:936-1832(-)